MKGGKYIWIFVSSVFVMGFGQILAGSYLLGALLFLAQAFFLVNFINGNIAHAVWGIITLGEKKPVIDGFDIIPGDNSLRLLVDSTTILLILLLFLLLYIYNLKSAWHLYRKGKAGKLESTGIIAGFKKFYEKFFVILMLTPALLAVLFFVILPIIVTFLVAFTNYSSPDHIPPKNLIDWIGFSTFHKILSLKSWSGTFLYLFQWNIIWAVSATFTVYVTGLFLALLISRRDIKLVGLWRTILILPYAIPSFVSLLVFRLLLSGVGPVNTLLENLGLGAVPFLSEPFYARLTIILVNIWIGAPYFMLLITGALTNIPRELIEASMIDGAGRVRRFFAVTLPMLLFQTAPVLVLTFAMNFNNFGAVYLLTGGNPESSELKFAGHTDILVSWLFKLTTDSNQYNFASVISILIFIFVGTVSLAVLARRASFKQESLYR